MSAKTIPIAATWFMPVPAMMLLVLAPYLAAAASQRECKAVESVAVVGYHDYDTVTITADKDEKECRFSVNGASAGSPPQEQITAAYASLVGSRASPGAFFRTKTLDLQGLALLLLAAGPDKDTDGMVSLLTKFEPQIETCRDGVQVKETFAVRADDAPVSCGVYARGYEGEFGGIGPFSGRTDEPLVTSRMEIVVRRGRVWNLLSIPVK